MPKTPLILLVASFIFCGGCGDDGSGTTTTDSSMPRLPGDGDDWDIRVVASGNVGLHLQMTMTSSGPVLVYYQNAPVVGEDCTEVGDPVPQKSFYGLYAARSEGTSFASDKIADILVVGEPPGLGLASSGSDVWVATLGGEPINFADIVGFCGGNDAVVYSNTSAGEGSWSMSTAVVSSDEAMTGTPASDFGEVVGYWPGLAVRGDGTLALAYKDIHTGSAQRDDTRRSDLEVAIGGEGRWAAFPVDAGRGAGDYNRSAFGTDGTLYVLYSVREESSGARGVWMARSSNGGAEWDSVRIASNSTTLGPSLAIDPSSDLPVAAFYDPGLRLMRLMRLTGEGPFTDAENWSSETIGDPRFDEGHDPALAFDASGRLAVAYRRCVVTTASTDQCDPQDDAVVFASSASEWEPTVVDEGEDGANCGLYPALGFDGLGAPKVAYGCERVNGGNVELEVRYASGEAP